MLTQSDMMRALGRARQAKGRGFYDADVNLPAFLTAKNIKDFIPSDLCVTSSQIEFLMPNGQKAFGYRAELLPQVCEVYLEARDAAASLPLLTPDASPLERGVIALHCLGCNYRVAPCTRFGVATGIKPWVFIMAEVT